MANYDVVIIGGGISGLICALKLLKNGFNVKIIERNDKIGSQNETKIDVTEDISVKPILKELDINILERSSKSKWHSRYNNFLFKSKIDDLFVKRGPEEDSFDVILYNKLRDLGGDIELNSDFKDFKMKGNCIESLYYKNRNICEIDSDYYVGADGSNPKTLDKLGLKKFLRKGETIVGYGFMSYNFNMNCKETNIFFDSELIPSGYFFIAKLNNGLGVSCLVTTKEVIDKPLELYFKNFLESNQTVANILSDSKPLNYFSGSCETGIINSRVKNNFCSVGDAAYVMDPIFGYGVRPAIISGYLAAENIIENYEIRKKPNFSTYESKLNEACLKNIDQKFFIKKFFNELNNEDLDFIIKTANFLNKKVNFDSFLENPGKYLDILSYYFFKNPFPMTHVIMKILIEKIRFIDQ
ncbi:MAG TPA: NAD(P)/FAD-dependent oxidoreductase [Candidatus Thermoplasmatota archaeon]|nr:NAD(P)/FAD-dependent oxidoreductase [Candidatus Thermoplasmatota archaeon]